ncbi:MAG: hypothetical protein WBZ36_07400 [Candidatus Nitrosopolaris sp.]
MNKAIVFGFLAAALTSMIFVAGGVTNGYAEPSDTSPRAAAVSSTQGTVVRDSAVILLEGKTIPANDYIHLYDTTPYMIKTGHIAAKLPCDTSSTSPLKILIGQAPNLKPAALEFIKQLSTPGKMCLYHVDVASQPGGQAGIITDIAIQNPTNTTITFPSTSTVVIGVDEITPGAEMAAGNNMNTNK